MAFEVLKFFEDYSEEPDPRATYTDLELDPARWSKGGVIEVRLQGPLDFTEETIEVGDTRISIRLVPGRVARGRALAALYRALPVKVASLDSSLIRRLAWETSRSGVEYLLIYLSSGSVAVLEGEAYNISVPFVESVGQIHTHPQGACGLSKADVVSGLSGLVEGAIFEAAATIDCIVYMVRRGLVSEDDYIKVKTPNSKIL